MLKSARWVGVLLAFFSILPTPALALTLNFSSPPDPVIVDEEILLSVTLTCSGCGQSYLRGAFFPSGSNYFGLTKNNAGDWIGTVSDKTLYFHIAPEEIINSSWSGQIKFKANSNSSFFTGPGQYFFKIGRYTSASGSATWSDQVAVNLVYPTPTPEPTIKPTPEPTPEPTPTSVPVQTPTPEPPSTPTPSPEPSITPLPTCTPMPTPKLFPLRFSKLINFFNKSMYQNLISRFSLIFSSLRP